MSPQDNDTMFHLGVALMKAGVDLALVEPEDNSYLLYRFVKVGDYEFQFYRIGDTPTNYVVTPEMLEESNGL